MDRPRTAGVTEEVGGPFKWCGRHDGWVVSRGMANWGQHRRRGHHRRHGWAISSDVAGRGRRRRDGWVVSSDVASRGRRRRRVWVVLSGMASRMRHRGRR